MGFKIGSGLIIVEARLLPPPRIKYKDLQNKETTANVRNSS